MLFAVLLFWAFLVTYGISPMASPVFMFLSVLVLVYLVATIYLFARAPRELVVERLTLAGVFKSRVSRIKLSEVAVKRLPERLYKGVVFLDGGGERLVVFTGMSDYDAFIKAIRERSAESRQREGKCQYRAEFRDSAARPG